MRTVTLITQLTTEDQASAEDIAHFVQVAVLKEVAATTPRYEDVGPSDVTVIVVSDRQAGKFDDA